MFSRAQRIIILFFFIASISGCATYIAEGPDFSVAPKPATDPNDSVIYLYRTDGIEGYGSERVAYIDDKRLLSLDHNGFTWFRVSPGEHVIKSDIPWDKRDLFSTYVPNTLKLTTEPGKTYYVHLYIGVTPQGHAMSISFAGGIPIAYPEPKFKYTKQLLLEDEDVALKRLLTYKYQESSWQ